MIHNYNHSTQEANVVGCLWIQCLLVSRTNSVSKTFLVTIRYQILATRTLIVWGNSTTYRLHPRREVTRHDMTYFLGSW